MSSTYRQICYHLVFCPKHRSPVINPRAGDELFNYIGRVIISQNCLLYAINGMTDHLHILTDLHPSVSLSHLVKEIKVSGSLWMKRSGLFPLFSGWQDGYAAFTVSERAKEIVRRYIVNQKSHHHKESYEAEYRRLLFEHNIQFNEKFLF